jgi:dipeptidyl-peptidase 4
MICIVDLFPPTRAPFLGHAWALTLLALSACASPTKNLPSPPLPPSAQGAAAVLPASASKITAQRTAAFPQPGWHVPRQIAFSPDGKLVTYLKSEAGNETMALFAYDVAADAHRVLLRATDLVGLGAERSREEELRRERSRNRLEGVTEYAWAEQANLLVLPLGGDVFARKSDGKLWQLTHTPEPELDPQPCPTGERVAFVRGRELYAFDLASGKETALTTGAGEGITHGQSDFVSQEEFEEPSGYWWSPRCDRLAYLAVDERGVEKIPVLGVREGKEDLMLARYPRVGTANPLVQLMLVDTQGKQTRSIEHGLPGEHYIGRLRFSPDGEVLYFQTLSRNQRELRLFRVELATGKKTLLLEERDAAWVEYAEMRPLDDGTRFVWTSAKSGHHHFALHDARSGALLSQLTTGGWDVERIVGADLDALWFLGNREAVLDRQLYAVKLAAPHHITKLTTLPGVHDVRAFLRGHGFIDVHSATDRIPSADVCAQDGKKRGTIPVPLDPDFEELQLRQIEIVETRAADQSPLYGALLKPRTLKPGVRYPAVVMVYGGPSAQTVRNEYNPRLLWQHLADRGVVVFQLDNRGSSGRGHTFQSAIAGKLGEVELQDQLRGLSYLCEQSYVDCDRVGIYGHSYGGYMVLTAMLRAPGRFRVGIAGSPVSDWRLYDTGYTERYMGLLSDNAQGYEATAIWPLADQLRGKLLIVHALMDENVHFAHTARMIDALVAEGKPFDLLVYPGERHGYRSPVARSYAMSRVIEYFAAHL